MAKFKWKTKARRLKSAPDQNKTWQFVLNSEITIYIKIRRLSQFARQFSINSDSNQILLLHLKRCNEIARFGSKFESGSGNEFSILCRIWLLRQPQVALEFDPALLQRVWLESPTLPQAFRSKPPLQIRQPMAKPFPQRKFMPANFFINTYFGCITVLQLSKSNSFGGLRGPICMCFSLNGISKKAWEKQDIF